MRRRLWGGRGIRWQRWGGVCGWVGAFNASEGVGDDVWWSTDGAAWQAATVSAAFLRGRNGNQMVGVWGGFVDCGGEWE